MYRFRGREGAHEERQDEADNDFADLPKIGSRTLAMFVAADDPPALATGTGVTSLTDEQWLVPHNIPSHLYRATITAAAPAKPIEARSKPKAPPTPAMWQLAASPRGQLSQAIYRHAIASPKDPSRAAALIVKALEGPSIPLPSDVRRRLEATIEADLGSIRVHTGPAASAAAAAIGAEAFAAGNAIVLGNGAYAPGTDRGEWLLAHEATHAVRHRGAPGVALDVAAEAEANATADAHVSTRRRTPDPAHRAAVEQMLRDANVRVDGEDLDRLAIQFGDGLRLTRWSLDIENQHAVEYVRHLVNHARGHQCPAGCAHPPNVQPLDDATRAAVEHTTGTSLGDVVVEHDAEMSAPDRLAEASGNVIRLAPTLPGPEDPLGREVRIHEAVHVAQGKVVEGGAESIDRRAAVETEAHAATDAAIRGERQPLGVRAAPGESYGWSLADAAKAIGIDPMGFVRAHFPQIATFFSGGFGPILQQLGDAAGTAFKPMLDGLGIGTLAGGFNSLTSAFKPGVPGILNGCCECLDHALEGLLKGVQGALDSNTAKTLTRWMTAAQDMANDSIIDSISDFFGTLKKYGGPALAGIEQVGVWIDQANKAVGGSLIWKTLAPMFGLDGSLPPIEAIKKKLSDMWETVKAAVAGLKAVASAVWKAIKQDPLVAAILKLVNDCGKLYEAIKKVREAKSKDPQVWLGILAKEMKGTLFEGLISSLQSGYTTAESLKDTLGSWVMGILGATGLLDAWNSAVPYLNVIGQLLKGWAKTVRDALTAIKVAVGKAIDALAKDLKDIWTGLKPYVDFVVGLGVAIALTFSGQIWALPSFVLGQLWLHVLPHCYKVSLTHFLLDLFIKLVTWFPAKHPVMIVMRSAALSFLTTIRSKGDDVQVAGMNTIAKVMSFDTEVVLGFFVGVAEGLWNSSLGFIVQAALFPLQMIGGLLLTVAGKLGSVVGKGFGEVFAGASWLVDAMANAKPVATGAGGGGGGAAATPAGPAAPAAAPAEPAPEPKIVSPVAVTPTVGPSGTEDSPDAGVVSGASPAAPKAPPPATPAAAAPAATPGVLPKGGPLFEGFPAFPALPPMGSIIDKVFHKGITRAEVEAMFKKFNIALDSMGTKLGAEAANKLVPFLTSDTAPYDLGEILGEVVGWLAGEIIMLVFTDGIENAIAKVAEELLDGAKLLERIGEAFPKLIEWLEDLKKTLAPAIEAFEKIAAEVAKFFEKVKSWVEEVIAWAKRQGKRVLEWIEETFGELGKLAKGLFKASEAEIELELEAEEAANVGFRELELFVANEAVPHASMEAKLREVKVPHTPDVHMSLSLETIGKWWSIRATGAKGEFRGEGQAVGRGAILYSEAMVPYYTAGAHGIRHAELIEAAWTKLEGEAKLVDDGTGAEAPLHNVYTRVREIAEATQSEYQKLLPVKNTNFLIKLEAEQSADVQQKHVSETQFIITPNTKNSTLPVTIGRKKKSVFGAVKSGAFFKGSFDTSKKAGNPETTWNYDGYPGGTVTQHPANDFLRYRNANSLGSLKPAAGMGLSGSGLDYEFVSGETKGGSNKEEWNDEVDRQVAAHVAAIQLKTPGTTKAIAKKKAEQEVLSEALVTFPGLTWDDFILGRKNDWQAHHVWENSWGGTSANRKNFQYLLNPGQHRLISIWWNARAKAIKDGLAT